MLEIYTGKEFIETEVKIPPYLVLPFIPTTGIVMFHGSPGIGKSTLTWQLANDLQRGEAFLGKKVEQTRVLLICLDMPKYAVWHRWKGAGFEPNFDIAFDDPFDCLAPNFRATNRFKTLQEVVKKANYGLVIVDALAEVHTKSMNADEVPGQVYALFREWFPDRCVMFIHHDRKHKILESGNAAEPTREDALGSTYWRALAQTTLHLYRLGDITRLV